MDARARGLAHRHGVTPNDWIVIAIDRRMCSRRAISPRRGLRAGGSPPVDVETLVNHSTSSVRVTEAFGVLSPANAKS